MQTALTDLTVRKLPEGYHWDTQTKGLGLRVGKNRRTWVVLISPGNRPAIGVYPYMGLAEARKECQRRKAEKTLGLRSETPRMAWDDALKDYLSECERKNRKGTVDNYKRLLRRFPFGRQAIADVTPRQIVGQLNKLSDRPSERAHAFTALRAFMRWCRRQHLIPADPTETLSVPNGSKSRDRVLTEAELKAIWNACETPRNAPYSPFKVIVRLLILTGQRRGEIARLEWGWIDQEKRLITFPASVTKNGRQHVIPYGDHVARLLSSIPIYDGSKYVFPAQRRSRDTTTTFNGWGKPKARLDRDTGIVGWTLHDIRRTLSSCWAKLGIAQVVTEKYLNHVSGGTLSPIAATYNRHAYLDEMRQAVDKWEAYLKEL